MANIALHDGFATMEEAIENVEKFLEKKYQRMHRETKETVKNFNKKCQKSERHITELAEAQQYSQQ